MNSKTLILFTLLTCLSYSSYIPQLILTTTADYFNEQIKVNIGPIATSFINQNVTIPNQTIADNFGIIKYELDYVNITQKVDTAWKKNIIEVTDSHNFTIHAQNINVTLKGMLNLTVAGDKLVKQKQMDVQIKNIQTHIKISFTRPGSTCPQSVGFGVFINEISLDSFDVYVNIKDKSLDTKIVNNVISLLKSRIPGIINGKIRDQVNEAIHKFTCNGVLNQVLPIGYESYVLTINTTQVPYFNKTTKVLAFPVDINFKNERTHTENQQVDNQNLHDRHVFDGKANCTATISSNMIDTVVWLVDDSNFLSAAVTKQTLGPNAPISLDTDGLAIILPGLRKFPNRDVIVRVNTSSEYSSVFIRSGRFLSGLSISADFIVNDTMRLTNLTECLEKGQCFVATTLNITLGLSASLRTQPQKYNVWEGLIQSLYIHQIQVIQPSLIPVNVDNLMKIIGPLISSARPQLNKIVQQGTVFDPSSIAQLKKLNLTGLLGQTSLDSASFGLLFDI